MKRYIRKTYDIHSVECRDVELLQGSLDAGHSVLIAPNHCRMSDPLTLNPIVKKTGRYMHAMASWHLFKQDGFSRFMLRRMGAFSVYREGIDRQAINTAVDILVEGKRFLVVFPEGAVSRHNDQLMPLMDGTSFIARTAAKRRQKTGIQGGVVVHPVAIRYFFRGDLMKTVTPVLEELPINCTVPVPQSSAPPFAVTISGTSKSSTTSTATVAVQPLGAVATTV